MFQVKSPFRPAGDQPKAIAQLTEGLQLGLRHQVLLGVTGSGKTFTVANVIQNMQRPTLVISHNKTLAAQLYREFKTFFPDNAVHYFVSYYDYYQPEAYIPQTDTYIEKDVKINEELDRLRHATTQAILTRNDVIVVASVSCIYNIGSPEEYREFALALVPGQRLAQRELLERLVELQYSRNDIDLLPGTFRVRGSRVEIAPATGNETTIVEMSEMSETRFRSSLKHRSRASMVTALARRQGLGMADPEKPIEKAMIFPAKFWVTPSRKVELALTNIEAELAKRLQELALLGKLLEAQRLQQRTRNDLAMMREVGYCHGIENYSGHLEFRKPGEPPFTLLDYFEAAYGGKRGGSFAPLGGAQDNPPPKNFGAGWLTIIDESHMTVPQLRGMYFGDKSRKEMLIDYGFRLPSAIDNRPLKFGEVTKKLGSVIYMSATPGPYEISKIKNQNAKLQIKMQNYYGLSEQLVRPTGLLDPTIEIRKTEGQIPYLIGEIKKRVVKKQRALVLTLTKRLAEELAEYLAERGIRVQYLHAEIKTLERPERIRQLRAGEVDALIGINLLREGIDIPEVSLVAILDADKEGFLRNETTIIQMMGRAARHIDGHAILFADQITGSMQRAMDEIERRRKLQEEFNRIRGVIPKTIEKPLTQPVLAEPQKEEGTSPAHNADPELIARLKKEMKLYVKNLEFERAARVRDLLRKLNNP